MTLIGFNAWQVEEGMTRRGKHRSSAESEAEWALMDPQTLANTICKASAPWTAQGRQELERLFNGTIHCLAAFGIFMAEIMVVVDGTQVVTTKGYQGCGCLKVTKWKRTRQGTMVQVVELVFGWRLISLVDLVTLAPLATKLVQIQEAEGTYLVALVKQAQANLTPYSRITKLVVDRAYVDGSTLYELDQMGITFILIAKSNMVARNTALALSAETPIQERIETIYHGQGRDQWTEEVVTRICAVMGIRTWDSYRPPAVEGERLAWEDRPALNAVVVTLWRNQAPTADGPRVYLTNGPVADPWAVVDAYDDRSWIEPVLADRPGNGLFRNSKQFWTLTHWFPKRTEAGVRTHLTFVVLMMAVATAYRLWDKARTVPFRPASNPTSPQVSYRVIDRETGVITDTPVPANPMPTHLASKVSTQANTESQPEEGGVCPPCLPVPCAWPQDRLAVRPGATGQADQQAREQPGILAHNLLGGQGKMRWQRQLRRENRGKVIVFIGQQYGIFDMYEFLVLSHVPVRKLPPHLGSHTDILRRYGCDVSPPSDNNPCSNEQEQKSTVQ